MSTTGYPKPVASGELHEAHSSWQMYMAMGRMACERGLYLAAARNYHSALRKAEQQQLSAHELAENLLGLVTCNRQVGDNPEVEKLFKRVLGMEEDLNKSDDDHSSQYLICLAGLYRYTGRRSRAEAVLRKALDAAQSSHIFPDPEVAVVLKNLAQVLFEENRLDEAEKYVLRALGICDTRSGQQTRVFADILTIRALIAKARSNYVEAEQLINQAIEVMEIVTGGLHPELANLLDMAANVYDREGFAKEATEMTNRAARMRQHLRQIDR